MLRNQTVQKQFPLLCLRARSLLFSLLSLFSRICYYFHPLVSFLSALVSLLFSLFSSVFPAARRLSRSELGSAAPLHAVAASVRRSKSAPLRLGGLYKDQRSLLLGRKNPRNRDTSNLSYLTALLLTFRAQPLRNSRSDRSSKGAANSTDPPPGTPEIEGCRPRAFPRRSREHVLRFSALFCLLLCSSSSSRPVLVPFWPHVGALGASKTYNFH